MQLVYGHAVQRQVVIGVTQLHVAAEQAKHANSVAMEECSNTTYTDKKVPR